MIWKIDMGECDRFFSMLWELNGKMIVTCAKREEWMGIYGECGKNLETIFVWTC